MCRPTNYQVKQWFICCKSLNLSSQTGNLALGLYHLKSNAEWASQKLISAGGGTRKIKFKSVTVLALALKQNASHIQDDQPSQLVHHSLFAHFKMMYNPSIKCTILSKIPHNILCNFGVWSSVHRDEISISWRHFSNPNAHLSRPCCRSYMVMFYDCLGNSKEAASPILCPHDSTQVFHFWPPIPHQILFEHATPHFGWAAPWVLHWMEKQWGRSHYIQKGYTFIIDWVPFVWLSFCLDSHAWVVWLNALGSICLSVIPYVDVYIPCVYICAPIYQIMTITSPWYLAGCNQWAFVLKTEFNSWSSFCPFRLGKESDQIAEFGASFEVTTDPCTYRNLNYVDTTGPLADLSFACSEYIYLNPI